MNVEVLGHTIVDDEKRQQLLIDKTWITTDGELIHISSMEVSHLQNAILKLKEFKHEKYFRDWIRILNRELRKRIKNKSYGSDTTNID